MNGAGSLQCQPAFTEDPNGQGALRDASQGGTGKSLVAALLAQYLARGGQTPLCLDADPVYGTLAGYHGLPVQRLPWRRTAAQTPNLSDARAFDTLLQWIAQTPRDVVIDCSAGICLPLLHSLASPRAPPRLALIRPAWVVHVLIAGGPALADTLDGFAQLAARWPAASRFVLWLNPFGAQLSTRARVWKPCPPTGHIGTACTRCCVCRRSTPPPMGAYLPTCSSSA